MSRLRKPLRFLPCLYACAALLVHPLVFRDAFFDINHVKTYLFEAFTFVCLLPCLWIQPKLERGTAGSFFCGAAFLVCAGISCLLSEDPAAAFTGENGRLGGWWYLFCLFAGAWIVTRSGSARAWAAPAYLLSLALCSVLAGLNFFRVDPLGFYARLSGEARLRFLSTIGNLDLFAAALCLALPLGASLFLQSDGPKRAVCGALLFLTVPAVIWCRADGAMIALFVCLYLALRRHDRGGFACLALIFSALGASGCLCRLLRGRMMSLGGCLCRYLALSPAACLSAAAVCALTAVFLRKKAPRAARAVDLCALSALLAVALAVLWFSVFDRASGLSGPLKLLRLSDTWGTYRGGVWLRCLRLFFRSDLKTRLLGFGPDCLKLPLGAAYGKEIAAFSGFSFDNAHCLPLQFLLTTGLAGLISLSACLFFALRSVRRSGDPLSRAILAACLTYLIHSLVTVTQPITGPLFVLLLAAGVRDSEKN